MRLVVVAVGRIKERELRAVLDDYAARVRRYAKLEEIEIPDGNEREVAAKIARSLPERVRTIALEVDGERMSSGRFASMLGRCELDAVGAVAFLVGGAYGLPRVVSEGANTRLSLSDMTLPHRLARLILFEQIYRAFTILRGEPYAH